MKSLKQIYEQVSIDHLSKFDKRVDASKARDLPPVIILKRKAVRVFPDNQRIGLYYSQALDKYVSIPFSPDNKALGIQLAEQEDKREEPMDRKQISESFRSKLQAIREEQLDEVAIAPLVGRVAMGMAGSIAKGAVRSGRAISKWAKRKASDAVKSAKKTKDNVKWGVENPDRALNRRAVRNKVKARDAAREQNKANTPAPSSKKGPVRRLPQAKGGRLKGALAGVADAIDNSNTGERASKPTDANYNFGNRLLGNISSPQPDVIRPSDAKSNEYTQRGWTTPRTSTSRTMSMNEGHLDLIHQIVKSNTPERVSFGDKSIQVTPRVAKKLITVYESLNKTNKKKFELMLNENAESFRKVLNFAIKA